MTTSGTFNFNPSLGELVLYSYGMIGTRGTALLAEHMFTARMAANLMLAEWSNEGVNLWAVDLQQTSLVQGTATYNVDPSTVMILDAYIGTVSGGTEQDRTITPIGRSEYATYPNKSQQGFPTVYWFDRLIAPTVTLFPVPDGNETYLKYYRVRQIQDSNFTGGQTVEVPYRFLNAFATGMAYWLSLTYAPDRSVGLRAVAQDSYNKAAWGDTEQAMTYITPQRGGYFRP